MPSKIAFASTTNGTVSGYAWSSQVGWMNFGTTNGNVHITDSAVTGYAWNENMGRLNLNPINSGVVNNSEGVLSGRAWLEGTGWINFSGVTVNSSGVFSGTAVGDNSVNINFGCTNCNVTTDWRPASSRTVTNPSVSGGGRSAPEVPSIVFSGKAYPKSTVTLLKDAQIASTVIADNNANFQITVSGLSPGNYTFIIYAKDSEGRSSPLLILPETIVLGIVSRVNDIIIAPTIAVDKEEVKRGDSISIFGQSAPDSDVDIIVDSNVRQEFFTKAKTNNNGDYSYSLNTSLFKNGQYFTKSKTTLEGLSSSFSKILDFLIGTENIPIKEIEKCPTKADLNADCRVNLVDISILIYWFDSNNLPSKIDLNDDGEANLTDLSIMAYYWTG